MSRIEILQSLIKTAENIVKLKLRKLLVATATVLAVAASGVASAAMDPNFILPTPENNTNATYGTYLH